MTQRIRTNVRVAAQTAAIRHETLEGRAVMIVPSVTLPDDIVMNGLRYPAAEIAKSYHTLERTPAPLGHPVLGGQMVSATDPEAMNIFSIGAFNRNVRRIGGRVHLEKVIDVARAEACAGGRRVITAIAEGLPIHTSTGLVGTIHETAEGPELRDLIFDHDAILLDADGAATPDDGVGMLVNTADGGVERLRVQNHTLPTLSPIQPQTPSQTHPQTKGVPPMDEDQIKTLIDAALSPLEATIATLAADVAALKTQSVDREEAERAELANQAVAQGLLTRHTANEASTKILQALLGNAAAARAHSLPAPLQSSTMAGPAGLDGYEINDVITATLKETPIHA